MTIDSLDADFTLLSGSRPESFMRAHKQAYVDEVLAKIRVVRPCRNDRASKRLEIEDAIDALASADDDRAIVQLTRADLMTLYRRAVFHHWEDVAYARVMLIRGKPVDDVARDCDADSLPFEHHCDPVNPLETM